MLPFAAMVTPGGSAPPAIVHVYGAVPPVAARVWAYGVPTCPVATLTVTTESGTTAAATVIVKSRVTLRPQIRWGGEGEPDPDAIADLHHRAHDACFIANSVTKEVTVEPTPSSRAW